MKNGNSWVNEEVTWEEVEEVNYDSLVGEMLRLIDETGLQVEDAWKKVCDLHDELNLLQKERIFTEYEDYLLGLEDYASEEDHMAA